jgi:septal ring factor EnvC (AmiA/AmiB activator)
MNPIVISTIIGAASFILTIFSALYLNHRHVDKLIEAFRQEIDAKLDLIRAEFKAELTEAKTEFRAGLAEARIEFKAGLAEVKAEQRVTNHRLEALEGRFKPVPGD